MQIHLITTAPVIKRLSLNEFTLWGQDLVSIFERVCISEVLEKIYEHFARTLENVHNMELCVLERCPYREVGL